ncbi:hypothetical protein, partial [Escherichia coli]|uniref:hypothetical protein n=1 Tax=Escherichia coli TaxID=562 RepID=UPI0034DACFBD
KRWNIFFFLKKKAESGNIPWCRGGAELCKRKVLPPPRPPASWGGFDADAPDSKKPAITDGLYNIRASYTHAN